MTREAEVRYDAEFFAEIGPPARAAAAVVVPFVNDIVQPRSVVDVGCGTGAWLAAWRAQGVADLLGLDGDYVDPTKLQIEPAQFRSVDLEAPPSMERTFDLAMSVEVAEHLAPSAAAGFVAYLTSLAPVLLFSAAIPGQGGVGHQNEQWPAYWAAHFSDHDYTPIDVVRPYVWNNTEVAFFYAQNLLLYVRRDTVATFEGLAPQLLVPAIDGVPAPLALTHPRFVDAVVANERRPGAPASLQSLLRQLPGATSRAIRRRLGRPAATAATSASHEGEA